MQSVHFNELYLCGRYVFNDLESLLSINTITLSERHKVVCTCNNADIYHK